MQSNKILGYICELNANFKVYIYLYRRVVFCTCYFKQLFEAVIRCNTFHLLVLLFIHTSLNGMSEGLVSCDVAHMIILLTFATLCRLLL